MKDLFLLITEVLSKSKEDDSSAVIPSTNYEDELFDWAQNNDVDSLIALIECYGKQIDLTIVRNKPLEYTFPRDNSADSSSEGGKKQTRFVSTSLFFQACKAKSYSFLICLLILVSVTNNDSYNILDPKHFPNQQTDPVLGTSEELITSNRLCYLLCQRWEIPNLITFSNQEMFTKMIQELLLIQSSDRYNALHAIAYENNTYLLRSFQSSLPPTTFQALLYTSTLINGYTPLFYAISSPNPSLSFFTDCLSSYHRIDHLTIEGLTILHIFVYTIAEYYTKHPIPIGLSMTTSRSLRRRSSFTSTTSTATAVLTLPTSPSTTTTTTITTTSPDISLTTSMTAITSANQEEIRLKSLQALLSHPGMTSALVNTPDPQGNTIIHLLTAIGWYDAIQIVINAGASLSMRNDRGETPFLCIQFPLPPLPPSFLTTEISKDSSPTKLNTTSSTSSTPSSICYFYYTHTLPSDLIRIYLDRNVDRALVDTDRGWTLLHKLVYTTFRDAYSLYAYKIIYPWIVEDLVKCMEMMLSSRIVGINNSSNNHSISYSNSIHSNRHSHQHILSILLKKQDFIFGNTLLHIVTRVNWIEAIEMIFHTCTNTGYASTLSIHSNEELSVSRPSSESLASAGGVLEGLYLKSEGEQLLATLLAIRNRYDETPLLSLRYDDTTLCYRLLMAIKDTEMLQYKEETLQATIRTDYEKIISTYIQSNLLSLPKQRITQSGETILHRIVRAYPNFQSPSILETLLLNGATPIMNSVVISTGETPLHIACTVSWYEAMKILLFHNASCSIRNQNGDIPLLSIVYKPLFIPVIKPVVSISKKETSEVDEEDVANTRLIERKCVNYLQIIQLFVEYGAKPSDERYSVLHKLIEASQFLPKESLHNIAGLDATTTAMKKFIDLKETISLAEMQSFQELLLSCMEYLLKDKQGKVLLQQIMFGTRETALHVATRHNWLAGIKFLMNHGAHHLLNTRNCHGETPVLMMSFVETDSSDMPNDRVASFLSSKSSILQYFLTHAVDITITNDHGHTILHKLLLSAATSTNSLPPYVITELLSCLSILLSYPMTRQIVNMSLPDTGNSPLHTVTMHGWLEAIQLLITQGNASVNARNYRGESPLLTLRCDKIPTTPNTLPSNKIIPMPRFTMIMQYYVNNGGDYSAADDDGKTLLHELVSFPMHHLYCSWSWYEEFVQCITYLCKFGGGKGFINRQISTTGDSALHIACRNGWYDAIEVLIRYGANVNTPNNAGFTPLSTLNIKTMWQRYANSALFAKEIQKIVNVFHTSKGMHWETIVDKENGNSFLHNLILTLPNQCYTELSAGSCSPFSFSLMHVFPPDMIPLLSKLLLLSNKFRKLPLTALLVNTAIVKGAAEDEVFCDITVFLKCFLEKKQLIYDLLDLHANIFAPHQLPNIHCFLSMLFSKCVDSSNVTEEEKLIVQKVKIFLIKCFNVTFSDNFPTSNQPSVDINAAQIFQLKPKEPWKLFLDSSVCVSEQLCLDILTSILNGYPRSMVSRLIHHNRDIFLQPPVPSFHVKVWEYLQSFHYLLDRYEILTVSNEASTTSFNRIILKSVDYGMTQNFQDMYFQHVRKVTKPSFSKQPSEQIDFEALSQSWSNTNSPGQSSTNKEKEEFLSFKQFVELYEQWYLTFYPFFISSSNPIPIPIKASATSNNAPDSDHTLFQLFARYAVDTSVKVKSIQIKLRKSLSSTPTNDEKKDTLGLFVKDWIILCHDLLHPSLDVQLIFTTESIFRTEQDTFESLQRLKQLELEQHHTTTNSIVYQYYEDSYYMNHWYLGTRELTDQEISDTSFQHLCHTKDVDPAEYGYLIVKPILPRTLREMTMSEYIASLRWTNEEDICYLIKTLITNVVNQLLFLHHVIGCIHGSIVWTDITVYQPTNEDVDGTESIRLHNETRFLLPMSNSMKKMLQATTPNGKELIDQKIDIEGLGMAILHIIATIDAIQTDPLTNAVASDVRTLLNTINRKKGRGTSQWKLLQDMIEKMVTDTSKDGIQSLDDIFQHSFFITKEPLDEKVQQQQIAMEEVTAVIDDMLFILEEESMLDMSCPIDEDKEVVMLVIDKEAVLTVTEENIVVEDENVVLHTSSTVATEIDEYNEEHITDDVLSHTFNQFNTAELSIPSSQESILANIPSDSSTKEWHEKENVEEEGRTFKDKVEKEEEEEGNHIQQDCCALFVHENEDLCSLFGWVSLFPFCK